MGVNLRRFLFLVCFSLLLVFPCFASDVFQSDGQQFAFSYDDSKIFIFDHALNGQDLQVSDQFLQADKFYLYVPYSDYVDKLTVSFGFLAKSGYQSLNLTCADCGKIWSNSYHYEKAITVPQLNWVGTSTINGSNASRMNLSFTVEGVPVSTYDGSRYFRFTFEPQTAYSPYFLFVMFLNSKLAEDLSGTSSNSSYSLSGSESFTGKLTASERSVGLGGSGDGFSTTLAIPRTALDGYYKSHYGSSVSSYVQEQANSLYIPRITLTGGMVGKLYSGSISAGTFAGSLTGSLSPDTVNQSVSLSGTSLNRFYTDTLIVSATRSYDDSELLSAVNSGFATTNSNMNAGFNQVHSDINSFYSRNHSDLTNISNQLGELVNHQDQVTATGNNIGGSTSESTISNTSGNLSSGTSSFNSVLSTASDISSVLAPATPYIGLLSMGTNVLFNFGNGVILWACIALIAVTVLLYILKKVAE